LYAITLRSIARAWFEHADPKIRKAAGRLVLNKEGLGSAALRKAYSRFVESTYTRKVAEARETLQKAARIPQSGPMLVGLAIDMLEMGWTAPFADLSLPGHLQSEAGSIRALCGLDEATTLRAERAKKAFLRLVSAFGTAGARWKGVHWGLDDAVLAALDRMTPQGRPWELDPDAKRALAGVPWLRVPFLFRGRRPGHHPFLDAADLLARIGTDDPDLSRVVEAAHRLRSTPLLALSATLLAAHEFPYLPDCGNPERAAATSRSEIEALRRLVAPAASAPGASTRSP
jgi:hypothetical protein